jgi:hypothetical protein
VKRALPAVSQPPPMRASPKAVGYLYTFGKNDIDTEHRFYFQFPLLFAPIFSFPFRGPIRKGGLPHSLTIGL